MSESGYFHLDRGAVRIDEANLVTADVAVSNGVTTSSILSYAQDVGHIWSGHCREVIAACRWVGS